MNMERNVDLTDDCCTAAGFLCSALFSLKLHQNLGISWLTQLVCTGLDTAHWLTLFN